MTKMVTKNGDNDDKNVINMIAKDVKTWHTYDKSHGEANNDKNDNEIMQKNIKI